MDPIQYDRLDHNLGVQAQDTGGEPFAPPTPVSVPDGGIAGIPPSTDTAAYEQIVPVINCGPIGLCHGRA